MIALIKCIIFWNHWPLRFNAINNMCARFACFMGNCLIFLGSMFSLRFHTFQVLYFYETTPLLKDLYNRTKTSKVPHGQEKSKASFWLNIKRSITLNAIFIHFKNEAEAFVLHHQFKNKINKTPNTCFCLVVIEYFIVCSIRRLLTFINSRAIFNFLEPFELISMLLWVKESCILIRKFLSPSPSSFFFF